MTKLSNYVSKTPEFQKLPEGSHGVRLVSYKETDSFHNYDGSMKEVLPEYCNPCEQLAITVVSVAGKGGITHRLNMEGYTKFADLTDKEVQSGKFTDIAGYACAVNPKTKKLERIPDAGKTVTCENILDQFFSAVQLKEGSTINDLDTAIADKYPFEIVVVNEPYDGADQLRISRFRKATVATARKVDIEA
jgi:hypothetical protein